MAVLSQLRPDPLFGISNRALLLRPKANHPHHFLKGQVVTEQVLEEVADVSHTETMRFLYLSIVSLPQGCSRL